MNWIYTAISQILLFWNTVWDRVLPDKTFLGTNWEWILAIVFLVITVRIILFPLFVKQIKSQRAMQALAPQIKELQAKHKGDKETLQKEMMELYRKEKANPLMGCLPMFLQIPVFLGLFHVLRRLNPERTDAKTTLYGWTYEQFHDASLAQLFGAPIWQSFSTGPLVPVKIVAGILVLIMTASTYYTSRQMILKTGWSEDPQQRMIQKLMLYGIPASLLISGFLYPFPIGVVIYWVVQNLFSLGQQFWVLRKYPPPAVAITATGSRIGTSATTARTTSAKPGTGKTGAAKAGTAARTTAAKTAKSTGKPAAGKTAAGKPGTQPARGGLFTRAKSEPVEAPPAVDGKALAPKVGAKPVNPKKGGSKPTGTAKQGGAKAKRPAG